MKYSPRAVALSAFVFFSSLIFGGEVGAQSKTAADSSFNLPSLDSVAKFQAIPNDLAFQLLGVSGNSIQQPGTVSDFLASVSPAVDLKGNLSPGLAVSVAPYQLLEGSKLLLTNYIDDPWVRLLSNTQVSFGSAPSKSADSSTDWGIGLRIVFVNTGDGRLDPQTLDRLCALSEEDFKHAPTPKHKFPAQMRNWNDESFRLITLTGNAIRSGTSAATVQASISVYLDTLESIADSVDPKEPDYFEFVDSLRAFVNRNRDENYLSGAMSANTKANLKNQLTAAGADPSWNHSSLDLNVGTVYKAYNSNISQSAFSKYEAWLSGGVGVGGVFQVLGQFGIYHQVALATQKDSTSVISALMLRYGGQDLRVGVGANGYGHGSLANQGTVNMIAEIRMSQKAWIVGSFDRVLADGMAPSWSPSLTIKFTGGFGFF